VDPTAKFTYVANALANNVSSYNIGSNGALTPIPGSPFAAGSEPVSVAVDPTAKFAYVTNSSDNVSAYRIGSDGTLTPIPGSPFGAGRQPISVAITRLARTAIGALPTTIAANSNYYLPANLAVTGFGAAITTTPPDRDCRRNAGHPSDDGFSSVH
jgi:DNA-binding beta-propeller fold protein YncE